MTRPRKTLSLLTVLSLSLAAAPAFADSSYDGTWVVDTPAAGTINGSNYSQCPALRFPIAIKDGQITGELHRVASATGDVIVEAGGGSDAAPITGTVQPDGTVTAQWMDYHAQGKLGERDGVVSIQGECGARQAHVTRIP
jgi:YD repeat-containing protein